VPSSRPSRHDDTDALFVPTEATPGGLSRRSFLAGAGGAATMLALGAGTWRARPAAAATSDRNLVVFVLGGGNDGWSTVAPATTTRLHQLRPNLVPAPSTVLPLGDGFGFHPSLAKLHARYQAGQVGVVGGVGTSGNLSHFESMRDWMAGAALDGTGWLGRWLDGLGADPAVPLRGVATSGRVPLLLVGRGTAGTAVQPRATALFGASRSNVVVAEMVRAVERFGAGASSGSGRDLAARTGTMAVTTAGAVSPLFRPALPAEDPAGQATLAGRLLSAPALGCRTVVCSWNGFDVHTELAARQSLRLAELDRAIEALFTSLSADVAARTTLLVCSEFGRRAWVNGGKGTDHGVGNYAFVVGPAVRGGVYGRHLDAAALDANGNSPAAVRHLDLIGTLAGSWLGADPAAVVGGPAQDLGLFTTGPAG
jgi:uncharacterized protein (DUF1501 family)